MEADGRTGSMSEEERAPAVVYPLAEFIADEMLARGWTTRDVAVRMGWKTKEEFGIDCLALDFLLAVQDDGLVIGDEQFRKLSRAFDVSEEFFRNLHADWQKWPERRGIFVCPEEILSGSIPAEPF